MANYLDEYLIGLGFEVNIPDLRKFESVIRQARGLVQSETGELTSQLLKWQAGITSGFAAIATATLGIADKVATADQSYRLFSERMYMTESAGRSLKRALDALGTTIEEASYDPEINKRVQQLVEDDQKAQAGMGDNFKANIKRIRDLHFEFTRLQLVGRDAVEKIVSDLAQHFAPQIDAAIAKMREWSDYVLTHLPEISDFVQSKLLPIFNDMWDVLKKTGILIKLLATDLVHLIGIVSGDDALAKAPLTFDAIATAIEHSVHGLAKFVLLLIRAETLVAGFGEGSIKVGKETWHAFSDFDWKHPFKEDPEYIKKLDQMNQGAGEDFVRGWAAMPFGAQMRGAAKGAATAGVMGFGTETTGDPTMDSFLARMAQGANSGWNSLPGNPAVDNLSTAQSWSKNSALGKTALALTQYKDIIAQASAATGIDEALLRAIITQESSGNARDLSPKGAMGLMQLMPDTAKDLGVTNAFDPKQNVMAGATYFQGLMKRYGGNIYKALEAYNFGMGNVDNGLPLPKETQGYVGNIMRMYTKDKGVSDQNFNITITVNGVTGGDDLAMKIKEQFLKIQQQINQRNAAALPMSY